MMRVLIALLLFAFSTPSFAADQERITTTITTATHKTIALKLEAATTRAERARGLMQRKSLGHSDGMAFFFPYAAPQKFWMKDTLIPLDMLFVDEKGSIVYIATAKPLSLDAVGPDAPVATVIELAGGRAKQSGIATGDKVAYDISVAPREMAR